MDEGGVAVRNVALALSLVCIVLAGGLVTMFVSYEGTINNKDSQLKTLTDQNAELTGWLEGNQSALDALLNVTNSMNVTNWPALQPYPSWNVDFYKEFTVSWSQPYSVVYAPQWEVYCAGYSKAFIYMRMKNLTTMPSGSPITVYLNWVTWYGSTEGGNDFLGATRFSENALNVTQPGSLDPQNGSLEVETRGPYMMFQFAVDSGSNVTGLATFDLSVYLRN